MGLWLLMKERHSILAPLFPFLFNEDYQLLKPYNSFIGPFVLTGRLFVEMAIVMPFLFRTTVL